MWGGFCMFPVFSPGDDPIACINKAMVFLTAVASSRFPSTNNQLKTSSNPRNQATIQDDRVTVQQVQGRQGKNYSAWYKEKAMLAEAQEAGQILDEEQLAFLADPGIPTEVPNFETYLNDMDNQSVHALQDFEQSPEKANKEQNNESITAELERYKERVKTFEQRLNIDLSSREKMIDSQMDDMIREKLALKEQVDSLEQNLSKQIKEKESVLQTFAVFKNESKEKENKYMENEIDLEKKIKELDNIICKVGQSAQTVHMLTKPQAFYDNTHKQALGISLNKLFGSTTHPSIESSYTPPVIVDVPNELPKVSLVNASVKKLKFHLTQFDSVVKKRTTPNALEEDTFNVFDKDLLNEITEVQTVFDQMEVAVQQSSVDKQCLEIAKKEIVLENDRLLQKFMSQDVLLNVMNSMSLNNDSMNVEMRKLFQNRDAHIDYLRHTQEQANTLWEIVEQAKAKQPLDSELDFACKYAIRIQELLVYVQDTCPNAITPSTKKVVVTPMNNVKKVRSEVFY
ncbi:hypothetical protein Tco_0908706 [Tanacetum coccineum]|uniref:Uncharacterized protein n=1 Tax=Tanacetum coccineum TaxID=301880 RepID=A0ABQ5CMX4_9ASTR